MSRTYTYLVDFSHRIQELKDAIRDSDEWTMVRLKDSKEAYDSIIQKICRKGSLQEYIAPFQSTFRYPKQIEDLLNQRKYASLRKFMSGLRIDYNAASLRLRGHSDSVELTSLQAIIRLMDTDEWRTEVDLHRVAITLFLLDVLYFVGKHLHDINKTLSNLYWNAHGQKKDLIERTSLSNLKSIEDHLMVFFEVLFG